MWEAPGNLESWKAKHIFVVKKKKEFEEACGTKVNMILRQCTEEVSTIMDNNIKVAKGSEFCCEGMA